MLQIPIEKSIANTTVVSAVIMKLKKKSLNLAIMSH